MKVHSSFLLLLLLFPGSIGDVLLAKSFVPQTSSASPTLIDFRFPGSAPVFYCFLVPFALVSRSTKGGTRYVIRKQMGRKSNWFCAVKKALSSEYKEQQDQRSSKSKKKWFVKKSNKKSSKALTATDKTPTTIIAAAMPIPPPAEVPAAEEAIIKQVPVIPEEEEEDEQKKHAQSIAIATAKAAEAAEAAAQAAAELVRLTNAAPLPGKPKEELSALRIQTAFRRYLAKRAFFALQGLASLKIVIQVQYTKHQTTDTLKSIQSLVRVQSQVCSRRLRVSEDNHVPGRLTLEKQMKKLEKVENTSAKFKEPIQAKQQTLLHEAGIRNEKALTCSLDHQKTWRSPTSKSAETMYMDMKSGQSGWSWLERWLAGRPWESNMSPDVEARKSMRLVEDEDAKSVASEQSSVAQTLPSPTESARAKTSKHDDVRLSVSSSANKRVSSPARSRRSASSLTDANSIAEHHNFIHAM